MRGYRVIAIVAAGLLVPGLVGAQSYCDYPCSDYPYQPYTPYDPNSSPPESGYPTPTNPGSNPSSYNNPAAPPTPIPAWADQKPNYNYGTTAPTYTVAAPSHFTPNVTPDGSEMQCIHSALTNVSGAGAHPLFAGAGEKNGSDPVRDGELVVHETDLTFPGPGIPFQFTRTYRSRVAHYGFLGFGWDFNYNRRIYGASACGDVALTTGDSGRVTFTVSTADSSSIRYQAPAGVPLRLLKILDPDPAKSVWQLKDGAALIYVFDAQGLLHSISDVAGNALQIAWTPLPDGARYVVNQDPSIPLGSDLDWRIASVTDATGRVIYFNYQQQSYSSMNAVATGRDGLFLQCLSLDQSCATPLVSFTVDNKWQGPFEGPFQKSISYGELLQATDSNGAGHSYTYYQGVAAGTQLPDSLADQYCSSACGPATDCHRAALCDRPESACLDYLATLHKQKPQLDLPTVCVDSILAAAGCPAQPDSYPFPGVWDPFCPGLPFVDHGCSAACIPQVTQHANWHQTIYPTNHRSYDLSEVDETAAIAGFCNEWCYATSLCAGGIPDLCRAIQIGSIPFCTSNCYSDCRARYQAKDGHGQPIKTWGSPEDLNHNLLEIRDMRGRLVQRNQYGTNAGDPSFDKVIGQTLGDDLLDAQAPRNVNFYYIDFQSQTAQFDPFQVARFLQSLPDTIITLVARIYAKAKASGPGTAIKPSPSAAAANVPQRTPPGITQFFHPEPYVASPDTFNSVEVCPGHCVKKAPRPLPIPPNLVSLPPPPIPPSPLGGDDPLILQWTIPGRTVQLALPETRGAVTFGPGAWSVQGPRGETLRLTSVNTGVFEIKGSDRAVAAFFGPNKKALLQSTAKGLALSSSFGRTGDKGLVGLSVLLERTGARTATASRMAAQPGTTLNISTHGKAVRLVAARSPGVFQVTGPAGAIQSLSSSGTVYLKLLRNGNLWQHPGLLQHYVQAITGSLVPDIHDYFNDVVLNPGDQCMEWKYGAPVTFQGSHAPQAPVDAVVVLDLRGVVRTEYYDAVGRLIREVNHHAVDGKLKEVTDYNYDDGSGALRGVRYPGGRRVCQESDGFANVVQDAQLPAPGAAGTAVPQVKLFSYYRNQLTDVVADPDSTTPLTIHFERDWGGRVTSQTTTVDASHNTQIGYTYDLPPAVQPRTIHPPDGSLTTLDDYAPTGPGTVTLDLNGADPVVNTSVYDANGRVFQSGRLNHTGATRSTVDVGGLLRSASVLNQGGQWLDTTYSYNAVRLPSRVVSPKSAQTISTDSLGHLRWIAETAAGVTGRATCFNYGADGRLESVLKSEGNLENYFYDDADRLTRVEAGYPTALPGWATACVQELKTQKLPQPKSSTHAADLQTVRAIEYDGGGFPKQLADGSGLALRFVVDGLGRTIETVDGQDHHSRRGYDARGRTIWEAVYGPKPPAYAKPASLTASVPLQSMVEYQYDNLDRVMVIDRWHFSGGQFVDPSRPHVTTTISHDDSKNKVSVSVNGRSPTVTGVDGVGRFRSKTLPMGATMTGAYQEHSGVGDQVTWTFTAPDGQLRNRTVFYNDLGQLTKVKDDPGDDLINVLVKNDYDDFGRLRAHSLGASQNTKYQFDNFDRLISITESASPGPRTLTYGWDTADRLAMVQDSNSAVTHYAYDGAERLESTTDPSGHVASWQYVPGTPRPQVISDGFGTVHTLTYDLAGKLARDHATNSNALVYSDGIDRLLTYTPSGEIATATVQGNSKNPTDGLMVSVQYDSLGNRVREDSSLSPIVVNQTWRDVGGPRNIQLMDRANASSTATFDRQVDDQGRLTQVTVNGKPIAKLDHESASQRITFGAGAVIAQPSFDQRGRWMGLDVSVNGSAVASQHDALGLDGVARERQRRFAGTSVLTDFYELDAAGRLMGENLLMPGVAALPASPPDMTDAAVDLFLTNPTQRGSTYRNYALDGVANWLSRSNASGTIAATFEPATGLNQYATFGSTWAYDASGDVTQIGSDTYAFDVLGNLATATVGGKSLAFGYDALGRRVMEQDVDGNTTTTIVWNGGSVAALGSGATSSYVVRVAGDGFDEHLALIAGFGQGAVTYLHQANDGSMLAATNDQGLIEGYSYSAFGETSFFDATGAPAAGSTIGNRFLFQGQLYNEALRSYYLRAREYRPDFGRFLSPDPIGISGGGENLYAFALGRPLAFIDPSGLGPIHASFGSTAQPSPAWQRLEPIHITGENISRTIALNDLQTIRDPQTSYLRRTVAIVDFYVNAGPAMIGEAARAGLNTPYSLLAGSQTVIDGAKAWDPRWSTSDKIVVGSQMVGGAAQSVGAALGGGAILAGPRGFANPGGAALADDLLAPTNGIVNLIPRSLEFARIITPEQLADLQRGIPIPFSAFPGAQEAFITNSQALPAGLTSAEVAQLATIPVGRVGAIIRFTLPEIDGLASPVNRSIPGFVGGGQTAGQLPEFVIPNQPIQNFPFTVEPF